MFHRVRSEGDQESQETNSQTSNEQTTPQNIQQLQGKAEQKKVETKSESKSQKTQTSNQTKDTEPMTEQTQEQKKPQAEAQPSAPEQSQPAEASAPNYGGAATQTRTGGYPGGYPGSSYNAPTTEGASGDSRVLTIGAGITMSGEIESCDYLVVEGTVEAALKGAKLLTIEEAGVFYGTVEIEEATIAGRFEGDITVNGRLTLRSTGVITGSIAYKELEVEAGAVIDGKITPVSAMQAQAQGAQVPQARPAPAAKAEDTKAATEDQPAPANSDGALFTDNKAAAE